MDALVVPVPVCGEQCCSRQESAAVSLSEVSFPLDVDRVVGLLDHTVVLVLVFGGNSILSSTTMAVVIYIPANSVQGLPFFHFLANTCYLFVFLIITTLS